MDAMILIIMLISRSEKRKQAEYFVRLNNGVWRLLNSH